MNNYDMDLLRHKEGRTITLTFHNGMVACVTNLNRLTFVGPTALRTVVRQRNRVTDAHSLPSLEAYVAQHDIKLVEHFYKDDNGVKRVAKFRPSLAA